MMIDSILCTVSLLNILDYDFLDHQEGLASKGPFVKQAESPVSNGTRSPVESFKRSKVPVHRVVFIEFYPGHSANTLGAWYLALQATLGIQCGRKG